MSAENARRESFALRACGDVKSQFRARRKITRSRYQRNIQTCDSEQFEMRHISCSSRFGWYQEPICQRVLKTWNIWFHISRKLTLYSYIIKNLDSWSTGNSVILILRLDCWHITCYVFYYFSKAEMKHESQLQNLFNSFTKEKRLQMFLLQLEALSDLLRKLNHVVIVVHYKLYNSGNFLNYNCFLTSTYII